MIDEGQKELEHGDLGTKTALMKRGQSSVKK